MRTYVAVSLIVCGTLLSLTPSVSEYLQGQQVAQFLSEHQDGAAWTFFRQPLDEEYRLAGWILGGTMIGLGILGGCRRTEEPRQLADDRHSSLFGSAN